MQLSSHLRLSRHGVWCFRLVLPENVAVAIGQREILKSLGTKRPEEARLKAYALSATLLPLLRTLRRILSIDPNSIDPKNVRELIVKGIVRDGTRVSVEHMETTATDPTLHQGELRVVEKILSSNPTPPIISEDELTYIEQGREEIRRLFGAKQPAIPEKLGDAIEIYLKSKSDLAGSSIDLYEARLKVFAGLVGGNDRLVHSITDADCVKAKEALETMPANASKRKPPPPQARNTSIKAKATDSGAEKPLPTLAAPTIKESLNRWEGFFDWAIGSCRYVGANPVANIPRPSVSNNDEGAKPFTDGELDKIFEPTQFMAAKRPHQFWGPLIALFTGCRSNEIAQLRLKDIVIENGILCFNFVHDPHGTPPSFLKNSASNRLLPIHPKLWEIGFQAYLDDLKAIGADRLFPNLPADENGKREKYLSRDFNEGLLVRVGVYQKRVKVMHSFRDTVSAALIRGRLDGGQKSDWLGHAREGTGQKHYDPPQTIQEKMDVSTPMLDFPLLDLSSIRYKSGWWNDWLKQNMKP